MWRGTVLGEGNIYIICGIVVAALLVCAGIVIFAKIKNKKEKRTVK